MRNSLTRRGKRVTLADVAAHAGVSVATASVAITGRPSGNCRVSPAVAEKIRRAARALNYRPNLQARNLSMQRTHTVALIVKRSSWHNAMFFLSAVQRVLRERGFGAIFLLNAEDRIAFEREHLETCIERGVEGIIMMPLIDLQGRTNAQFMNQMHDEEQIPIVQLGLSLEGCTAPSVVTDEAEGMRMAVAALHERGHRRIAHVTMHGHENPSGTNPYRVAYQRSQGYRDAMAARGLEAQIFSPQADVFSVGELYECGVALSREVASATPRPTGIVAYSDYTAAGLIAGLSDAGKKVPESISVIGFGDQPFARMVRPALTTLAPQYERLGEAATAILLEMLDGKESRSVALPPTLVMRQSVAET